VLPKDTLELARYGHSEIIDTEAVEMDIGWGVHKRPYFMK